MTQNKLFDKKAPMVLAQARFSVRFACNKKEVKQAQKLRYKAFVDEFGVEFSSKQSGIDEDRFDKYCLNLLLIDDDKQKIVGTYRLLTAQGAKKAGGWYSASEFDLSPFKPLMPEMIEVGRACIHKDYRLGKGGALLLLWRGLIETMKRLNCRYFIGCGSVPIRDGGAYAVQVYKKIQEKGALIDQKYFIEAKNPLDLSITPQEGQEYPGLPVLIRGYLKLGAVICSFPSVDPIFKTADMMILFDKEKSNQRYLKKY